MTTTTMTYLHDEEEQIGDDDPKVDDLKGVAQVAGDVPLDVAVAVDPHGLLEHEEGEEEAVSY